MRFRTVAFTENETLALLAAALTGIAHPGPITDAEDLQNLEELRSAVAKLAQGIGMDRRTLAEYAALAAGKPEDEVLAALGLKGN